MIGKIDLLKPVAAVPDEVTEVLASGRNVRIERIVSMGQSSPSGFWYDQDEEEFVVLLSGSAVLLFEDGRQYVDLKAGEAVLIHAHVKHRVESTDKKKKSVWLAVFFQDL